MNEQKVKLCKSFLEWWAEAVPYGYTKPETPNVKTQSNPFLQYVHSGLGLRGALET